MTIAEAVELLTDVHVDAIADRCPNAMMSWEAFKMGREAWWIVLESARAIARSPYDIAPCKSCGLPTVCLSDGMPLCEACGEKGNE